VRHEDEAASRPVQQRLQLLEAGAYRLREICHGIFYYSARTEELLEYADALEIEGFPIPSSLRVTGLDKSFTTFGLERGRLFQMYRIGEDTSAEVLLLMHGASTLTLEGYDAYVLPEWCNLDQKANVLRDLGVLAKTPVRRLLSDQDVQGLRGRFYLPLLGGIIGGLTTATTRFMVPTAEQNCEWADVHYRLTVGWSPEAAEPELIQWEIAGPAMAGSARALHDSSIKAKITLFFGEPEKSELSAVASRPDPAFIHVCGADVIHESEQDAGVRSKFRAADLTDISRRSGIPLPRLQQALGSLKDYRLQSGLLQRLVYSRSTGSFEYLTVIPDGDWRTVEYGSVRRRLSLRRYIILTFHCTPMGPHRSRDRTVQAIMDAGCWWQRLYQDVQALLRACIICKSVKDKPLVTGHQRSREYDGPFRYIIIDYVGPMNPPSGRGHRYMFTAVCAWSGWYWAFPTETDDSRTAAHYLFNNVICDIAGYPMCIGSDQGKAFVEGVVRSLVKVFNIEHVIGTAYHPQAQSAVERPHREYNAMCKTFMEQDSDWDLMVGIFVWTVRSTAKLFNGYFTPYETITGLKPRSPIDAVFSTNVDLQKIATSKYVADLVKYLKHVHAFVDKQHALVREDRQRAMLRTVGPGQGLVLGDHCMVKKTLIPGVSSRFQSQTFDSVFQVVEVHGDGEEAKAYTVCDFTGRRENLGFTQPVAYDRLIPIELLPLAVPCEDSPTRISVNEAGVDREGTVTKQVMNGNVYIRFDDSNDEICCDLTTKRYRWIY